MPVQLLWLRAPLFLEAVGAAVGRAAAEVKLFGTALNGQF